MPRAVEDYQLRAIAKAASEHVRTNNSTHLSVQLSSMKASTHFSSNSHLPKPRRHLGAPSSTHSHSSVGRLSVQSLTSHQSPVSEDFLVRRLPSQRPPPRVNHRETSDPQRYQRQPDHGRPSVVGPSNSAPLLVSRSAAPPLLDRRHSAPISSRRVHTKQRAPPPPPLPPPPPPNAAAAAATTRDPYR
mmetsp:Transcript_81285/g.162156  ORF Transcript_81285/g.162156 Transcript_81285/m.162156 type:complete len:188 (-) Transcript_81285:944-1507(-)